MLTLEEIIEVEKFEQACPSIIQPLSEKSSQLTENNSDKVTLILNGEKHECVI